MSFIPKNPLSIPEIEYTPSTPSGTRGLFAGKDGWYEVDAKGTIRKLVSGDDVRNEIQAIKSLQYYGDANIVPSDASLFKFSINEDGKTASVSMINEHIGGDIIVPYECKINEKNYIVNKFIGGSGVYDVYEGSNVESITLPATITSIGVEAFFNWWGLKTIEIPDGVTSIGNGAFHCIGGGNIESVTIPDSVISIGAGAFEDCDKLTDVYFRGSKSQWEAIEIGEVNEWLFSATIHYEWSDVTKEYVDEKIKEAVIQGEGTVVDDSLDLNSENPVQNKVVAGWIKTFDTEIGNNTREIVEIHNQIGDIDTALDILHNYAQALIGGEA